MPSLVRTLVSAAAIALLTAVAGWWAPALVGLIVGAQRRRTWVAFWAGALGWMGLLGWQAAHGPVWTLAGRLAGIVPLPALGVLVSGPLFAGLLAWSAAEIGGRLLPRQGLPAGGVPVVTRIAPDS